ncbi:AsmA family protein [Shewanella xiamenensis]|uniref:AsmA family protein n=1 Tax=Shewanella xiamenensis TaxID=332186 RepID=UPI001C4E46EC|nr:AsmA family protein [Shewanella xiamenensis]MBW0281598.1 cell envelope biogenesis protein AsmA [Shewanella xiamenensis]MCT8870774.1 AsmA family protein [Shewanella xiamenensis]UWH40369.1 AsmA family protein [Shewanella xiamenensis]
MKFIKWFLALLLTLVVTVTLYLTVFFDPNDFKPEVVNAVKKQTGRELVITDDLSWTFFPTIGINLGGVSLSNPEGFTPKSMLEVNKAVAEVELIPLFSKQIEIAQLTLDGAKINLVTRKNGGSSLDGLTGKSTELSATPSESSAKAQLASIDVGGISITNTQINLIDEAKGQTQTLTLKQFTLGAFSLDKFAPMAYEFAATLPDMTVSSKGEGQIKLSHDFNQLVIEKLDIETQVEGEGIPNKKLTAEVSLNSQIALDKKQLSADISKLTAMDINAVGKLTVNYGSKVPKISADFQLGDIDLDALLPKSDTSEKQTAAASSQTQAVEPDLTALNGLDAKLILAVKSIKVANLSTQNWLMDLGIKNGEVDLKQLSADLYQGKLMLNAQVDARSKVASYQFDKQISGVQIQPLLKDAAKLDILAGTANFNVKGKGKSLIPEQLKKNLLANGRFDITDGALYGVNIPQMIRSAQAKLKGDLSADTKEERKTDFSSLTGNFSLEHGVATNPDLAMSSPLLRLAGKGSADLLTQTLDYRLTTSLVNSLKGQGGSEKDALAGIDIPLAITGTFQKPEYALDTQALLNNQLKEETDKAKEKLKNSLLKKLGGL